MEQWKRDKRIIWPLREWPVVRLNEIYDMHESV